jgi:hypothetical protein
MIHFFYVFFFAAPSGIGLEGRVIENKEQEDQPEEHYWGQALQYLDRAVAVEPDRKSKFF